NSRSPRGERCGQPLERDFLCSRSVSQSCASAPQPGRFLSAFKGGRRAGWRHSADRTCLRADSLLTGNFAGKLAILTAQETLLVARKGRTAAPAGSIPYSI